MKGLAYTNAHQGMPPQHSSTSALPQVPDRFMRLPEVLMWTGLRRSTLYVKIKEGRFPRQKQISRNCVAWYASEVFAWINKPT